MWKRPRRLSLLGEVCCNTIQDIREAAFTQGRLLASIHLCSSLIQPFYDICSVIVDRNCSTRFADQILPMASRPTVQLSDVNTQQSSHNHKLKCVIRFLCLPKSSTSWLTNLSHKHYLDANVRMAFCDWYASLMVRF